MSAAYVVPVAALRRVVPSSMEVAFEAPFDAERELTALGEAETDVEPDAPVTVRLRLESYAGGIRVRGSIEAPWHGVCRRCAARAEGVARVSVDERFVSESQTADELSYSFEGDELDLTPLVHDAIMLDLPLAPLCREACAGLCPQCGADLNEGPCGCTAPSDPRWATLDALRFPGEEPGESHPA